MIRKQKSSRSQNAFTLLEVMIASSLMTLVLVGVLATFLMINRTSFASGNYSQIEAETRRALEIFGQEARLASDIHWSSSHSVTLTLLSTTDSSFPTFVTYAYDDTVGSPTQGCFYRLPHTAPASQPQVLMKNVTPDFAFHRYRLAPSIEGAVEATTDAETKQLQVTMRASIGRATTVAATQTAISAAYILRNKNVSR